MDPQTQLARLVTAGAWLQEAGPSSFGPKIALGAVEWIEGRGLLFAELGAEHQGHVHLIEAARLALDGNMVDAYATDGQLVATVHAMSRLEVGEAGVERWLQSIHREAWIRFWADQVTAARK